TSSPREVTSPDEQPITEPLTHRLQGSEIQTRVIVDQKHECNPAIHTILIPQPHQVPISDIQDSFEDLTLAQVQGLMLDSLKKYCGLMALQHIQLIEKAHDVQALKQCQVQWLTLL